MLATPHFIPGNSGLTIYSDVLARPPFPEFKMTRHSHSSFQNETSLNTVARVGNGKILHRILSHLPMKDLLTCRLVCSRWDRTICFSSSPEHAPSILWTKTCIKVKKRPPQKQLKPFTFKFVDDASSLSGDEWYMWQAIHSSHLFTVYKCPNLHIQDMDLKRPAARDFLIIYGNQIHHLDITNCDLSLVTLQKIMAYCPHLVYLKIKPVPYHSLIYGESLLPEARPPLMWMKSLKTLTLYSDYKKHANESSTNGSWTELRNRKGKVNRPFTDNIYTLDYVENHLHPSMVEEIVCAAPQLCEIAMYGWTGDTVASMLKSLAAHQTHHPERSIKKLEFHDVLLMFDSQEVEKSVAALPTSSWSLESFALSFLSPLCRRDMLASRLDTIVRRVLLMNSKTLVSINLKNCSSVDESIFMPVLSNDGKTQNGPWFPKLETLELAGTNIRCLSSYVKLMPSLNMVNFEAIKYEDDDQKYDEDMTSSSEYDACEAKYQTEVLASSFSHIAKKLLARIEDKIGPLIGIGLLALTLTCVFHPFMNDLGHPWAFYGLILLFSVVYFAYLLQKTLPKHLKEGDILELHDEDMMDADPEEDGGEVGESTLFDAMPDLLKRSSDCLE